jgi:hypothetical protein
MISLRTHAKMSLLALFVLSIGGRCVGCARASTPTATTPTSAPTTRPVELGVGKADLFRMEPLSGGDLCQVASGMADEVWLFFSDFGKGLQFARRTSGMWTGLAPLTAPNWTFIERLTAIPDASGNPVVIWSGYDGQPGEALVAARWSSEGWSEPQPLDRLATSTSINELISLRDSRGRIHVVYDRPLPNRESYSRGFPPEGEFPDKCFHAVFDAQHWSKPQATTGPGRFYVTPLALSEGVNGSVLLAIVMHRFTKDGFKGRFLASQSWDGQAWSAVEDLAETDKEYDLGLLTDRWGARIAWYPGDVAARGQYGSRVAGSLRCFLQRDGRSENLLVGSYVWPPRFGVDFSGRVVMLWRVPDGECRFRLWNGREWSETLNGLPDGELVPTQTGNWLLVSKDSDGIHLQEIVVRERTATTTPSIGAQ